MDYFLKTHIYPLLKIAKMIGVTLRYKWITSAMCMVPGLEPVLPSGRLSLKNVYISPGSGSLEVIKTHSPLCIIKKNDFSGRKTCLFQDRPEVCLPDGFCIPGQHTGQGFFQGF